jgi:hypothetical protein
MPSNSPPPAPDSLVMPHVWETTFMVLVGVPAIIAILWALREWRRTGDPLYVWVLAGGTACAVLEPLVDVLGLCWYPRGAQFDAFELMGRPIPLFPVIGYTMWAGGGAIVAMEVLKRKGPQGLWWVWIGGTAFTSMFEFFAVHTKTYVYYGSQPLRLFDWPTWWGPVNSLTIITIAVVFTALRPLLRGWRALMVIALMPALDGAANGAAAWPAYTTNWSDVPWLVSQASGLATWGLSALLTWLLITFSANMTSAEPSPLVPDNRITA